ncbi:MAG: thioredoxin domain-containing protein [Minisyncoccia bacterium]
MNKFTYGLIGLIFLAGVIWLIQTPGKPSKYDSFAQCIRDTKTVTFYGAFWCPHCQAQKARFGKSAKYLPYVECSTPDSRGQLKVCIDSGITTYPTWEFSTSTLVASTTRITGEMELLDLSEKTGCKLPE